MIYVFFFNDTATTEIYTEQIVGSVRCVQETDLGGKVFIQQVMNAVAYVVIGKAMTCYRVGKFINKVLLVLREAAVTIQHPLKESVPHTLCNSQLTICWTKIQAFLYFQKAITKYSNQFKIGKQDGYSDRKDNILWLIDPIGTKTLNVTSN
eukprot:TRINITY_DN504_c0_g3_i5.p1 TRINITY_DN504_c0_g3~~TRINITY_DN504_c0_g3_i5.p1  ORF type:complete len:151 (+),score=25.91 TRINITY_DN504_c0_g3_i5:1-453(+)